MDIASKVGKKAQKLLYIYIYIYMVKNQTSAFSTSERAGERVIGLSRPFFPKDRQTDRHSLSIQVFKTDSGRVQRVQMLLPC